MNNTLTQPGDDPLIENSEDVESRQDVLLMSSIALGDKSAMTSFVSKHLSRIIQFAMRYLGRRQDAEDVAQEAFFRVWQYAERWESREIPPKNWLYKITYNLCIDEIRKRKNLVPEHEYLEPTSEDQPDTDLIKIEKKKQMDEALETLPERQRTAIVLYSFQGFSNRDAADIMEISVEALESLLARGRRKLKELLIDAKE